MPVIFEIPARTQRENIRLSAENPDVTVAAVFPAYHGDQLIGLVEYRDFAVGEGFLEEGIIHRPAVLYAPLSFQLNIRNTQARSSNQKTN